MTIGDINTAISMYANADTNQFTNAERLIFINKWMHKIVSMILQSQDGWDYDDVNQTDYPIITTDLVANQQDYTLPASEKILKVKRVEISYDGTNWYKAEPLDVNEIGSATDSTTLAGSFNKTKPYYDLQYHALFLYPIPDAAVTGGLKMWVTREAIDFTSGDITTGTKEPPWDEPFHHMLALGVAYEWAVMKGRSNIGVLKQELIEDEQRLKQYYSDKQKDKAYTLKPSYVNYE